MADGLVRNALAGLSRVLKPTLPVTPFTRTLDVTSELPTTLPEFGESAAYEVIDGLSDAALNCYSREGLSNCCWYLNQLVP